VPGCLILSQKYLQKGRESQSLTLNGRSFKNDLF
jgi:hypothetical protein